MVLKSAPNRNDAGAWARSHLQAPITNQYGRGQHLRITDSNNAVSHTKLLSAHFRTSRVFCPPAKWDRRSGECFWRSDSPGDIARHMWPASFTFFLLLMKEKRWINSVRQGSTVMQIGNFTFETIPSAEPLLWTLISFACEQRISYPGSQRLSCAVSGFGQASTCGWSRTFCRPVVDTEECRLTPKRFLPKTDQD